MNHPIHPEEVEFAGLVMGREAVAAPEADALTIAYFIGIEIGKKIGGQQITPARTLAIVDAHHAKLMTALDAKDAEIARLTAAGPVAAQPQGEPVAWAVYAQIDGVMVAQAQPMFEENAALYHQSMYKKTIKTEVRALYTHSIAQPAQPAVPVTDAEVRLMFSDRYNKPTPDEFDLMRAALESFLASRRQA